MVAASSALSSQSDSNGDQEYDEESYSRCSSEFESYSSTPEQPRPPRTVAGRYKLGAKLGAGSYSDVHVATDKITGERFAVKLEWQKAEKTDKLLKEAELYKELPRCVGMPKVYWSGSEGEYNIMVLDLLGPSLDDLFCKLHRFSVKSVVMAAKQIIDRLQQVHKCGILYRDIKPHNFLMGSGEKDSGRVHIVDFGLSKKYIDKETGEHLKMKFERGRGIAGTVRYSSPNLHEGYDASRRDDLFALGYVLMHLLRGDLPWLHISSKDKKVRNKRIGRKKAEISDEELCEGFPTEFVQYFCYVRSLEFYDEPDYMYLQRLLDRILIKQNLKNDLIFDWTPGEGAVDNRHAKKRRIQR